MRLELQKMLSHCGMANNSGSRTTLVSSNQQCSGPLYTGVRQSVSKKAELPTQTNPANKWLPLKGQRGWGVGGSQLQHMQQVSHHNVFISFVSHLVSYGAPPARRSPWNTPSSGREYLHALTAFHVFITELHL